VKLGIWLSLGCGWYIILRKPPIMVTLAVSSDGDLVAKNRFRVGQGNPISLHNLITQQMIRRSTQLDAKLLSKECLCCR
jgi:hypothetical protein